MNPPSPSGAYATNGAYAATFATPPTSHGEEALPLNSSQVYGSTATNTISGLDSLAGQNAGTGTGTGTGTQPRMLQGGISESVETDESDTSGAGSTLPGYSGALNSKPGTELVDAVVASDRDLGLASGKVRPLNELIGNVQGANKKVLTLKAGNVLFAPTVDTKVMTPFGNIDIDAKSIVLVIASKAGLAVFNLDDAHRNAVRIQSGGKEIRLSPSRQAMITTRNVHRFEQVNPVEAIGYRYLSDVELGDGLKAFNSEFSIPSAVAAIKPLRHLISSQHPEAVRLSDHLMKTAAALMQMKPGAASYQRVPPPRIAAFINR